MAEGFGARMRERRERQQISLVAIAEQTKIKLSLLDALEHDNVSHWPTGIFRRAFIRAYARAIDLDPDVVVREFLEIYPDPAETATPVPAVEPGVGDSRLRPAPPMRLRFLVRSAMDSVTRTWEGLAARRRPESGHMPLAIDGATTFAAAVAPAPAAADMYAEFSVADESHDAAQMLRRAADLLNAVGLVVWTWDPGGSELVPTLAHGYSDRVLAQLPTVRRDADNATAAAFRSTQTCIVRSSDEANGAVVVPLMTSAGCVGVFAVELPRGAEQREPVRALTTSLAGQFADLIGAPQLPHAASA